MTSFAHFVKTDGVPRLIAAGILTLLAALSLRAQETAPQAVAQTPPPQMPPASTEPVDFTRDIKPILQTSCVRCHARGKHRGGFSMETRDALLEGGDTGPAIVPGKSADSLLVTLVAGLDPDLVMPQKGSRLKPAQIGLLRAWIDQGAPWDAGVTFARSAPKNLQPRQVVLPPIGDMAAAALAGTGVSPAGAAAARAAITTSTHPVDRLVARYYKSHNVTPGARADDRVLARRLYFDVLGVPPTPAELQAFLADTRPNKRARLVDTLLADRHRYAEHWISFWNDLLRNDYRGPGYIDGGRRQITAWLYAALANNLPYDQFVAQLVNPARGAEGFAKGIVWRGVVNASQTPPLQAAQNISQVFMGVNLKCASCHDSFINDWQLSDAYGLAGIYADAPLEMVECDRPTGKTAPTKFLYTELGTIDGNAARAERLAQLAQVITSPKNGRLPRTIVNRLWARFMGRGLVEPVDDMDQAAWDPDLLDWLAEDLVAHHYDLKHTMRRILTSRAYQAVAVDVPERVEQFVFRGPAIRRLSAEQFVDALSAVTGVWQEKPIGDFDFIAAGTAETPGVAEHTRASFVTADPLMTALGRPNREQVLTTRAAAATTLQALELQNGATLAKWLRRGAEHLLAEPPNTPDALLARVYQRALGRAPTATEAAIGRELLGATTQRDGVEDLLWSLAMLPEFQLIY